MLRGRFPQALALLVGRNSASSDDAPNEALLFEPLLSVVDSSKNLSLPANDSLKSLLTGTTDPELGVSSLDVVNRRVSVGRTDRTNPVARR